MEYKHVYTYNDINRIEMNEDKAEGPSVKTSKGQQR